MVNARAYILSFFFSRLSEISLGLSSMTDIPKSFTGNADNSECSTNTNTEEYATCTDTSRRTPGMRTTLTTTTTTTSSSSTTQVPGLNTTKISKQSYPTRTSTRARLFQKKRAPNVG